MTSNDQAIADLRENYTFGILTRNTVEPDPFDQFETWFEAAREFGVKEINAMTLATVGLNRAPSTRIVLLKGTGNKTGFDFYTSYESRKGRELKSNPQAAITFLWKRMERQVNIRGEVEKLSQEESEAYFRSRPRHNQIGAWASDQSAAIPSREWLDDRLSDVEKIYPEGSEIPMPENWGGYRVRPLAIEFWQGRPGRLHDRIQYSRTDFKTDWAIKRLSP